MADVDSCFNQTVDSCFTQTVAATEAPWGAVSQFSLGRLGCSALCIAHVG